MKIIYTSGGEYQDCIVKYFDLQKYEKNSINKVLFYGWASISNIEDKKKHSHSQERYFLNTVSPCEIINGYNDTQKQEYFTHVFTICPYTADVLNCSTRAKYIPICFPYQENNFEKYSNITIEDKNLDVMYYGQIHHPLYNDLLDVISKFKYAFTTISGHGITPQSQRLITHYNLSTIKKWDLLSRSKTCVGFNRLFLDDNHIQKLKNIPNIEKFKNIQEIYATKTMPQMKTRMIEAANTKTLMLMHKDSWNVIEHWFEPNKHFIYWDTFKELKDILVDVKDNYEKYWPIVECAHGHVKNYSLSELIKKYE